MLDRTPTDSGSRESELQLDEVMVFVAKLVVVSGICRCTTLYCLNKLNTGFCRIFATELEDRRPKTGPYLEEVVE